MITTEGKLHIKRYLAGMNLSLATAIAYGAGSSSESASDIALQLETGRSPIILSTYDFVNDNIVYKATVTDDFAGVIYEIGLYSNLDTIGDYSSRAITTFDSGSETWLTGGSAATFTTTGTRVGVDSLSHTPAGNGSSTSILDGLALDFFGDSGADRFVFAFNNGNTNASTINFRFKTDASNYYTFTVSNPSAGYQIVPLTKASATVTGSPDWSSISAIEVNTNSKAAGASAVNFDAIRIENDSASPEYVLIDRKVLSTPITVEPNIPYDIEFNLKVNV